MKMAKLRKRLRPDRPMTTISLRMPEDVIEDLKRVAPLLGFSGYQPLIRAYRKSSQTWGVRRGHHLCSRRVTRATPDGLLARCRGRGPCGDFE